MNVDPEDQEIIRLLTKIKDAEAGYPEHMLVQRRRSYLRRMREVSLGIPAETAVRDAAKDIKPSHISPTTTVLVETALVIAIIAEASTVAYFYRHRLTDFIRRVVAEPGVQEATHPPVVTSSFEIQSDVTIPSGTIWSPPSSTGVAATLTATPVLDVIPGVVDTNSSHTAAASEVNVLNATPGPNDSSSNNGNNGHHYGQTPKPERTKENGNNPPPKDNENKPPEKEKPPKEDKPPKEHNNQPAKDDNDIPPSDNSDKPPKN
jgi:hypothetical protein